MDGINQLAKMFKERDNQPYLGPQIGKVISSPPDIKISLGEKIVLTKENLIIAAHVLNEYQREINVNGDIQFSDSNCGNTTVNSSHSHNIDSLNIDTSYVLTGSIIFTDSLQPGDEVILIPTIDEQIYFLVDKAVRL